jgi:hypothetical protein
MMLLHLLLLKGFISPPINVIPLIQERPFLPRPTAGGAHDRLAVPCFVVALGLGRLRHHLADEANDYHQRPPTDAATGDARHDGADVKPARRRGRNARAEHSKNLAAESTAEDADKGVADRAEVELLEQRPSNVAASRTADQLNDQGYDIHDDLLIAVAVCGSKDPMSSATTRSVYK